MVSAPALPGLFCCFAAFVLLVFACVSGNVWDKISFLDTTVNGRLIHFGVFGYTGIDRAVVGYNVQDALGAGTVTYVFFFFFFSFDLLSFVPQFGAHPLSLCRDGTLGAYALKSLTIVMILHPIAAAFALVACLFGFCGAGFSRIGTILMSLCAAMATLITLIVWVVDMSLWGIVRNRLRSDGFSAEYGNANCECR